MRLAILMMSMTACLPSAAPVCEIAVDDTEGRSVTLKGSVTGVAASATVRWHSDLEGPFAGHALGGDGASSVVLRDATPGAHRVRMSVREGGEAVCIADAIIEVPDVPAIRFLAPLEATPWPSSPPGTLIISVSGGAADVTWSSDVDGPLGNAPIVDGTATLSPALSIGTHLIEARAEGKDGTSSATVRVRINQPPGVPPVTLTDPAHAGRDLEASIAGPHIDADGDALTYRYAWSQNGIAVAGLDGPSVPRSMLQRDDQWRVQVIPSDGIEPGLPALRDTTIVNAPPVYTQGSILPASFDAGTAPRCAPVFTDPDGDDLTVDVRWTVNGVEVGQGPTLEGAAFTRDDLVGCIASATDGTDVSGEVLVAEAIVGNSPPRVTRTVVAPRIPHPGQPVTCDFEVLDEDGDDVEPDVVWTIAGQVVGTGATIVTPDDAGSDLRCTTTPFDGIDVGIGRTAIARIADDVAPHNILFIVIDDVGVERIGAYGMGDAPPPTPNIDALAAEGVRFDRAWATPTCSATRASYFTGKHGFRTGIGRASSAFDGWPLSLSEVLLPELFQIASDTAYTSVAVGKWHVSNQAQGHGAAPLDQGFLDYQGVPGNLRQEATIDGGAQSYYNYEWASPDGVERRTTYLTTEEADEAVAQMALLPEPWFLHLAFHAAHLPGHTPPRHLITIPDVTSSSSPQLKLDADTEALDTEIGRVLAAAPPNTTVILLGDNGTPDLAASGPYPVGQVKTSIYEGGVRVPLIVTGPWVTEPGTASRALVHVVDLFATIGELAGVPPDHPLITTQSDGQSILPYVVDPGRPSDRDLLYTEYFKANGFGPYEIHRRAVRDERFKLAWELGEGYRLHDIGLDWLDGPDLLAPPPLDADAAAAFDALRAVLEGPRFQR